MERNRIVSMILVAIMVFTMVPTVVFADTIDENWENCTACSEANPHIITTKAELNKIREHVKAEGGIGGYFRLGNDIVFEKSDFEEGGDYYRNGAGWLPIGHNDVGGAYGGNNGIYFDGSFDGNGFAVSGLYTFYESNTKKYNGLFAMLGSSAHIFNLTLRDFDMQADVSCALAGMVNSDNVLIENIIVDNCNMKHINDSGNASGLLVGKLQGKSTVQNIVIKNSTYDSKNEARQGWIAGLIQGTKIKNVAITNCTLEGIHSSGLLAETIRNGAELDNITINDSTYVHTYWDENAFIANTVSADVKLSNITMNLKVTGKKTDDYENSVMRIKSEKTLFGTANVLPQMKNVNLNIAFDMTDAEKGTQENGSLKMRVENNVIYVIEATNQLNKIKSNGAESIAYTDGATFADGTVFESNVLTAPNKINCLFSGWYTDSEFTAELTGSPVAGSSYYAKWEALSEREFIVSANKTDVVVGEEVEVTVTLNGTDLVGAEWTLVYDAAKFELISGEINGKKFAGINNTFAASEVMATYTFKALVQAPDGIAATFTVDNCDAWDLREANMGDIYTVPNIMPTTVITIDPTYEVDVNADVDYVAGKKLVLVYTNSADISFAYAGAAMYDVSTKYTKDGYAYSFAIVADAIEGDYAENVAITYGTVASEYVIIYDKYNYDINNSGEINLRDVTVVFGVYNGNDSTFANYMNIVLNADINADGVVNGIDTDAFVRFVRAYTVE